MSDMNEYKEKIEKLKSRLASIQSESGKVSDIQTIVNQIDDLETKFRAAVGKAEDEKDNVVLNKEQTGDLYRDLRDLKLAIKSKMDEYKRMTKKLEQLHDTILEIADREGVRLTEIGKTTEEQKEKRNELEAAYEEYGRLEEEIRKSKEDISKLSKRLTKLSSISKADELEMGLTDYKEIADVLRNIVDFILGNDELVGEISKKASKDRTYAEKKQIKEAKERITREIHEEMESGRSIRESIEILYNLDIQMFQVKKSRQIKMNRKQIENIIRNSSNANVRIVGSYERKNPLKAPDDMTLASETVVINRAKEAVAVYKKQYHALKSDKETEIQATEYIGDFLKEVKQVLPNIDEREASRSANRVALAEHDYQEAVLRSSEEVSEENSKAQAEAMKKLKEAEAKFEEFIKEQYEKQKAVTKDDEHEENHDDEHEIENEDEKIYSEMTEKELRDEIKSLGDYITMGGTSGSISDEELENFGKKYDIAKKVAKKRGISLDDDYEEEHNDEFGFSSLTNEALKDKMKELNFKRAIGRGNGDDVSDIERQIKAVEDEAERRGISLDDDYEEEHKDEIDYSTLTDEQLENLRREIISNLSTPDNSIPFDMDKQNEAIKKLRAIRDVLEARHPRTMHSTPPTVVVTQPTSGPTTPPTTASTTVSSGPTTPPTTASTTVSSGPTTPPTTASTTPVYSVQAIIAELTHDLDIGKKDVKRYNSSNIRVRDTFKNELHAGNYLYNIVHVVPTAFKATASFFRKLGGKLMLTEDGKKNVETIKQRLDSLSDDKKQFLFDNYRGNAIIQDMNVQINDLISAKLKQFGLEKLQKTNDAILRNFQELSKLNEERKNNTITDTQYYAFASVYVKRIIKLRKMGNSLLSGGIHGQQEDFKATASKMNFKGLRFAKIGDFDSELQDRLGSVEQQMNEALAVNEQNIYDTASQKEIVDRFLELEALYSKNTEVKNSIFGKRSVGAKSYTPLLKELNYNPDPFIRDLLTTIGTATSIVTAVKAVNGQKIISEHNNQVEDINKMNRDTIDSVHETGRMIADKREVFGKGMQAQAQGDALGTAGLGERYSLDSSNWHLSSDTYRELDSHFHQYGAENYANISSQINDITNRCGQGAITNAEALQEFASISSSAHSTFIDMANQYKEVLANYAASHPQFDLSAYQGSIDALVSRSDAIVNMNNAMVDTANLGGSLVDITLQEIEPLASMPGLYSSLVTAASCAILSGRVSNGAKKSKEQIEEGNREINDMLDEFDEKQNLQENSHGHYI